MKRILCITGDAASGKTTTARSAATLLPGWRILSTGQFFRDYCSEHGLDPQQISSLDEELHRGADERMQEALLHGKQLIAEARLAGYLARDIPDSLRVYCDCPLEIRVERFRQREPLWSHDQARRLVVERDEADWNNLHRLYGIDYRDPGYYHLRLQTDQMGPDEIAARLLQALSE